VKTSYYANIKNLDGLLVAISLYPPVWVKTDCWERALAPDKSILLDMKQKLITENEYYTRFREQLENTEHLIYEAFKNISERKRDNQEVFLLCYEKPTDFCHRHILSEFLSEQGLKVSEFGCELYKPELGRLVGGISDFI